MPNSEDYVRHAIEWLANKSEGDAVKIHIDLPDIGWVTVRALDVSDGGISCRCSSGLLAREQTLLCSIDAVTAVRKVEDMTVRDIFGD